MHVLCGVHENRHDSSAHVVVLAAAYPYLHSTPSLSSVTLAPGLRLGIQVVTLRFTTTAGIACV